MARKWTEDLTVKKLYSNMEIFCRRRRDRICVRRRFSSLSEVRSWLKTWISWILWSRRPIRQLNSVLKHDSPWLKSKLLLSITNLDAQKFRNDEFLRIVLKKNRSNQFLFLTDCQWNTWLTLHLPIWWYHGF